MAANTQARKPISKAKIKANPKEREAPKTLEERRLKEWPKQSLAIIDKKLYCQACNHIVNSHKGNCANHMSTATHKANRKKWSLQQSVLGPKQQRGIQETFQKINEREEMRLDSITAAAICGIGARQICRYNKLMQSKHKFKHGAGLIQHESS